VIRPLTFAAGLVGLLVLDPLRRLREREAERERATLQAVAEALAAGVERGTPVFGTAGAMCELRPMAYDRIKVGGVEIGARRTMLDAGVDMLTERPGLPVAPGVLASEWVHHAQDLTRSSCGDAPWTMDISIITCPRCRAAMGRAS